MADTIITNTPNAQDSGDSVLWGATLAIIIAAIAIGAVVLYQNGAFQSMMPKADTTNINVSVPTPTPTPTPAPGT